MAFFRVFISKYFGNNLFLSGFSSVESSRTMGASGLIGGQLVDLNPPDMSQKTIETIIDMKTGALFELSFTLGWIFGGGDMDLLPNVRQLALHFGRAFQILDDIDDIEKDRLSGKTVNYALQFGVNRAIKAIDAHLSVNGSSNSSEAALELNQAPFLSMILKSAAISKIEPAREMPSPKRMSNSATLNGDINKIMSTTDNNNHASSSTENNSNSYETRMKSLEDQISNLSLAFTRYMKEPIRESYGNSDNLYYHIYIYIMNTFIYLIIPKYLR
ncbi:hypothetical protein RB653_001784 [Dictyostelium firmibasis]|uniref:Uncharacterized protein n=1 Tax=Dictyostelium firmibasis TaxID=79012 RepID=A0AAN7TWL9_9MYCE